MVLAALARTEPQTSGIGVLATLILAALGGAWWPIEITPEWMQALPWPSPPAGPWTPCTGW